MSRVVKCFIFVSSGYWAYCHYHVAYEYESWSEDLCVIAQNPLHIQLNVSNNYDVWILKNLRRKQNKLHFQFDGNDSFGSRFLGRVVK